MCHTSKNAKQCKKACIQEKLCHTSLPDRCQNTHKKEAFRKIIIALKQGRTFDPLASSFLGHIREWCSFLGKGPCTQGIPVAGWSTKKKNKEDPMVARHKPRINRASKKGVNIKGGKIILQPFRARPNIPPLKKRIRLTIYVHSPHPPPWGK